MVAEQKTQYDAETAAALKKIPRQVRQNMLERIYILLSSCSKSCKEESEYDYKAWSSSSSALQHQICGIDSNL